MNELSEIERAAALFRSYREYQASGSCKIQVIDSGTYRFFWSNTSCGANLTFQNLWALKNKEESNG